MTYDPEARRDTPLALKLKERIRRDGPITVAQYMEACLQDPEHGYYRTKTAIGAKGDFVTAPEISQVFGELIGLWCAVVWQQMGSPSKFNLVELGPGRGTLMADALRATKIVPGFHDAAHLVLVESNATLRAEQQRALASHARVVWRDSPSQLRSEVPVIIIGNEFFDTCPVEQFEIAGRRAVKRVVEVDDHGRLSFGIDPSQLLELSPGTRKPAGTTSERAVIERPDYQLALELRRACAAHEFAAVFLDYGYVWEAEDVQPLGESLQAVRDHQFEHPLAAPGLADLTAHVDFTKLEAEFSSEMHGGQRFAVDGPVTQANFLGALGIMQRASKLMTANPAKAHEIETGVARLMAVPGMGDRFKVIGIRSANLPPLPGFETANSQ